MKIHINKDKVFDGFKAAGIVTFNLAVNALAVVLQNWADGAVDRKKYTVVSGANYGDAVSAIMSSDMLSRDMHEAVNCIPRNEDSSLYDGIIAVAKSSAISHYKKETIKEMCSK